MRVTYPGFAPFESAAVHVASTRVQTLNFLVKIETERTDLMVSDVPGQVGVDPSQSVGPIVLRGNDLDSFSDNPEDLAYELQMLAGPAARPDGGQIFIDGFSGEMPPKASIREIRVNQNPFSAEYDRAGFGRVEVFTKPGSGKYHSQASFAFANRAFTARNLYVASPIVPDYQQELIAGNFGGPLSQKASFFLDAGRRITDESSILNYTSLDSALNPVTISGAVIAPSHRFSTNPRLDYAITPNNTLALRHSWVATTTRNQGINTQTFDQVSKAHSCCLRDDCCSDFGTAVATQQSQTRWSAGRLGTIRVSGQSHG